MLIKSNSIRLPAWGGLARAVVLGGLLLSFMQVVNAYAIEVSLGPPHTITSQTPLSPFDGLNGTPLGGQSLSADFSFSNNEFARIFTVTSADFQASIKLQTNSVGFVGYLDGTGYLIDIDGNAIPGYGITGSASGSDGWMAISLFPLLKDEDGTPNTDLLRPFDFYGVHYDLIFPLDYDPSIHVTGGEFWLSDPSGGVFGVGPGLPRDIVPDSASTLLLLGIGLAVTIGLRSWRS
jgi:hypothetical protein